MSTSSQYSLDNQSLNLGPCQDYQSQAVRWNPFSLSHPRVIQTDTCVSWSVSHRCTGVHLQSVMNGAVASVWERGSHSEWLFAPWRWGVWMGGSIIWGWRASGAEGSMWDWVQGTTRQLAVLGARAGLSWKSSCRFCCNKCYVCLCKVTCDHKICLF